ncbi:MAG: glycosyltransferase family A protein [Ignavibacteriaceae bacterium]|nr:glycosyltransferase family A protein [Ignavibacteriaceae bacterium]
MINTLESQPEVSVILSVFNREQYLNRCLDSLMIQSFKNWELIAIDDGSEDNSFEILKEYQILYHNIQLIRHKNMKLPLSRNKGILASNSKFITFIDSDDEYTKDHLKMRVEYLNAHPEVDMIRGGIKIIGNEYVRDKNNPFKMIHLSECTVGATFFGRRYVFLHLNGFQNLEYSEDSDFLDRAEKCFRVDKVDFNTYKYYREVPDSITNNYFKSDIPSPPPPEVKFPN